MKIYKEKSNKQTIFEISGFPHWENVSSNVLAFFLNPTKEHKLNDLLIKSLFQSIDKKVTLGNLSNISVTRERSTINGGRLDILIISENFVIVIENKIYANLYNDLDDYSKTIEKVAEDNGIAKEKIFKIVLSIKNEKPDNSFYNITYSTLFKNIRSNCTNYIFNSDNKYFSFLFDFITTFEKPNIMDDNNELVEFFENNSEQIDKLMANYKELSDKLLQEFRDNFNYIEIQELYKTNFNVLNKNLTSSWGVYRDDCTYKGYSFKLQFAFSPTKGLTDLFLWSNEETETRIIKQLDFDFDKRQYFKPSQMIFAATIANKMIRDMIETLDKQ